MKDNLVRKFFSASILIVGISVFARIFGLLKEVVLADTFGLSVVLDTFYIGLMLPAFLITSITNPLSSSFIPRYNQLRAQNRNEAAFFFRKVFSSLLATLVLVAALFFLLHGFIFDGVGLEVATEVDLGLLSFVFSLYVVFQGLSNYLLSVLENLRLFWFTSFGALLSSISIIVFVTVYSSVLSLAQGLLSGTILFLLFQLLELRKKQDLKLSFELPFSRMDSTFLKEYGLLFLGSFMMGATFLVDQTMAASLGETSVSALNYGFRVVSLFTGTATLALGAVSLPFFSELYVEHKIAQIEVLLNRILLVVFVGGFLLTVLSWFYASDLVALLFERGKFTTSSTEAVSEVFVFYMFQLPFYVGGVVMVRLISVLQKNKSILVISAVNLCSNVVLNIVLMNYLGLKGIALSTSIVYFISFVLLWRSVKSLLRVQKRYE